VLLAGVFLMVGMEKVCGGLEDAEADSDEPPQLPAKGQSSQATTQAAGLGFL
jgi:hypothetical protein